MKAFLKEDIITTITENGDTEIGRLPKVGLERLRFNGSKVIDLVTVGQMWIRYEKGFFTLHIVQVRDSQLVNMTYSDRKYLIVEGGVIVVKTQVQRDAEALQVKKDILKTRLREKIKNELGTMNEQISDAYKLIAILIVYARNPGNTVLGNYMDELLPELVAAYPFDRVKGSLKRAVITLKTMLTDYYSEIDSL